MVKDEEPNGGSDDGGNRRGGRGGGPGGAVIGLFAMLLFRNPKLALAIGVIAAIVWFFGGFKNCSGTLGLDSASAEAADHSLGCRLDRASFDQAQVFEPLAPGELPRKVSLEAYAPPAGDQGTQGSCTAWATAYSARTIQEAAVTGEPASQVAFSPSYLYNQLSRGSCQGTSIKDALELVRRQGLVPLSEFPYSDQDCSRQPTSEQREEADRYRIAGFNRLTRDDDNYAVDVNAVKQNLAQGAPVVVGMLVGGSFYQLQGEALWEPTERDYAAMRSQRGGRIVNDGVESGFGGHAMTIIGYDDDRDGGAFQLQNSWGQQWGQNGRFWMRYRDVEAFSNELGAEVYGLYPQKKAAPSSQAFEAAVGLVNTQGGQLIPLNGTTANTFSTAQTLPIGTKFKMEVTNSIPCYTYVLGQLADGSSNVLFPYTPKHSPYCGIVGRRVFPKDYSMQLDNEGTRDVMAVVLTKQEIDVAALNTAVNQQKGSYAQRLAAVLGTDLVVPLKAQAGERVQFSVQASNPGQAVLIVVEIPKR